MLLENRGVGLLLPLGVGGSSRGWLNVSWRTGGGSRYWRFRFEHGG